MRIEYNVSANKVSWVKSNKARLDESSLIENLYYPEDIEELKDLLLSLIQKKEPYEIIGFSSNTLFLPTYRTKHLICTRFVKTFELKQNKLICDCGTSVRKLSKFAVEHGFVGFEGLTDLPGTVAAAVYGNCGCRGCSVNSIVSSFTMMLPSGDIKEYTVHDIGSAYRSTLLKRKKMFGVILQVTFRIENGNPNELMFLAKRNHAIRKELQPTGANNLGTTINGCSQPTLKGYISKVLEKIVQILILTKDRRKTFPIVLRLMFKSKFIPYIYYPNRYMFLDELSHLMFNEYFQFYKSLYKDARLEIEIRK